MHAPITPAAAKQATRIPRQERNGLATRASMNTPMTNRMIAHVARSETRSASDPDTSHPMMPGSTQAANSTDSAVARPPGSAKCTTRLRNPGI